MPTFLRCTWLRAGLCAAALLPAASRAAPASEPPATLIVLDASGSMRSRIEGERKIEIARRVVRELVQGLPDGIRLGLVAYGHRDNTCSDIELLIPPDPLDKPAFVRAVNALRPRGRTPISASLRFSAEALGFREKPANIVLISDGQETCGADPCETARILGREAAGLTIHTVGFDLSAREAESIECIALATGGRFFAAHDAASLREALELAIGEIRIIETATDAASAASLRAPEKVTAGAAFEVEWRGPNGAGDYLVLVPRGTPDGVYRKISYTMRGNPLTVDAPDLPGDAELRYVSAASRTVLARLAIDVLPPQIKLSAPDEAAAGLPVSVEWSGSSQPGDQLTIVPRNAPDTRTGPVAPVRESGASLSLPAPDESGDCELRYVRGGQVLARRLIRVITAGITLRIPAAVPAGSVVPIVWTGPNRPGDFLTIVPKGFVDGKFAAHAFTSKGSPAHVPAPPTTGPWEVRYISGQGNRVLARTTLEMAAPEP
ncbi:MAG TPA: VWA domain-containing protein [Opitutaceae bacterium]